MSNFMIRVELHGATSQNYTTLAESLRAAGITDIVVADSGKRYKLPPAEYTYRGDSSKVELRKFVEARAAATGRPYAVVVCEGYMTWSGLQEV